MQRAHATVVSERHEQAWGEREKEVGPSACEKTSIGTEHAPAAHRRLDVLGTRVLMVVLLEVR